MGVNILSFFVLGLSSSLFPPLSFYFLQVSSFAYITPPLFQFGPGLFSMPIMYTTKKVSRSLRIPHGLDSIHGSGSYDWRQLFSSGSLFHLKYRCGKEKRKTSQAMRRVIQAEETLVDRSNYVDMQGRRLRDGTDGIGEGPWRPRKDTRYGGYLTFRTISSL